MNIFVRRAIGLAALFATLVAPHALAQSAIPQTNWTLQYVDSQDTAGGDYAGVNAFDGNPATMWVTEWFASSPPPPHEIRINLGASYDIAGFRYLPRQDGVSYGNIAQYAFYVSTDGVTWGTAVATGTFSNGSTEKQVLFTAKRGQYVRLRALSEVNGQPWSLVAELSVLSTGTPTGGGTSGTTIPQGAWTLHSVDSQETSVGNYRATAAFDGDRNSMWATQWIPSSPPPPHDIRINLGATYNINGFRYLPRQDGVSNGSIGQYEFYVSTDGVNWGSAVASGSFSNIAAEQQVTFSTRSARYVRLRALSEINGAPWTTVAELNVLNAGGGSSPPANQPPAVSLSASGGPGPYQAPASFTLQAGASDVDGTVSQVEFYLDSTLIRTDTTSPYSASVQNLGAGTYTYLAVAQDNSGNRTSSSPLVVTVGQAQSTFRAVFTPSSDHATLVLHYVMEVFPIGANVTVANPVASIDLGKPSIVNGECQADVTALVASLPTGTYVATVTAVGSAGSSQSAASPQFNR